MAKSIHDRSFWAGKGKGNPLPEGVKERTETSAVGAGHLDDYCDTTDAIKKQQEMGISKAKGHSQKTHYRN